MAPQGLEWSRQGLEARESRGVVLERRDPALLILSGKQISSVRVCLPLNMRRGSPFNGKRGAG